MLKLSERELDRLGQRVEEDYLNALPDHQRRMDRWREYYRLWRGMVDPPAAGDEDKSNYPVPLMQWHVFGRWAQMMQSILGDDAEIVAEPHGPADHRLTAKIGRYATVRYLRGMNLVNPLSAFIFRAVVFGRSFAYRPWVRDTYDVHGKEEVWYEGPGFFPQWPDDIIVPAEDVDNVQQFSWTIRKYRTDAQGLLDGERAGMYFGITENWEKILNFEAEGRQRDETGQGDEMRADRDEAEGVTYEGNLSGRGKLTVLEWYGKRRLPKGKQDAAESNWKRRQMDETHLVVRYLLDLDLTVGVEDLAELYPGMKDRVPIVETSLVKEGSYWSPGIGELVYHTQTETTNIHNIATDAMEMGVAPTGFYEPAAGFDPKSLRYGPYQLNPVQNAAAVKFVTVGSDLNGAVVMMQALKGNAEMLTGYSEQNSGRAIDRPNAPKTAAGQMLLVEQGNIRLSLDVLALREDLRVILQQLWQLDTEFAPPEVFFRVTEEEVGGLFETSQGGAKMTAQERAGRWDFTIKFATSAWSREAEKEKVLARYQLDMGNPLIVTNPKALWKVTADAHKALGDPNFGDLVPEPPDMGLPKNPREEWTLMLQGEDVTPHPQDNHDLHLMKHYRQVEEARASADPDEDAVNRMVEHIIETQAMKKQQMMMQAMAQALAKSMAQTMRDPSSGGLDMGQPMGMAPQQVMEMMGQLGGGMPGGGAPGGGGGAQGGKPKPAAPGQ